MNNPVMNNPELIQFENDWKKNQKNVEHLGRRYKVFKNDLISEQNTLKNLIIELQSIPEDEILQFQKQIAKIKEKITKTEKRKIGTEEELRKMGRIFEELYKKKQALEEKMVKLGYEF